MAFRRARNSAEPPQIDWDDLARQLPNLRRPILIFAAFVFVWILFSLSPRLYTDYRWFEEVGFTSVFTTQIITRLEIFAIAALGFFLFYLLNIVIARRLTPRVNDESSKWAQTIAFAGKSIWWLLIAGGLFLAFVVGMIAQADWLMFLRYANAQAFGVSDPIFQQDVSFYVFTLPVYRFFVSWLGGVIILDRHRHRRNVSAWSRQNLVDERRQSASVRARFSVSTHPSVELSTRCARAGVFRARRCFWRELY